MLIVIKKFNQVMVRMSPFAALVALFGAFIVYNGGVVLGKSNCLDSETSAKLTCNRRQV